MNKGFILFFYWFFFLKSLTETKWFVSSSTLKYVSLQILTKKKTKESNKRKNLEPFKLYNFFCRHFWYCFFFFLHIIYYCFYILLIVCICPGFFFHFLLLLFLVFFRVFFCYCLFSDFSFFSVLLIFCLLQL